MGHARALRRLLVVLAFLSAVSLIPVCLLTAPPEPDPRLAPAVLFWLESR
jgi:hypothetical protein